MQSNIDVNINFGGSANNFQSLIDNTNKLSATIGQLEQAVNDYTTKATGSNAKAAKSVADYTGSYKTLSAELAKNRAALKDELDALTKLRGVTGVVSGEVDKQEQAVRELEKTVRSQTSALNQYNKTLGITSAQSKKAQTSAQSLTKTFNSLGAVLGISFGAYGAFRVLTDIVKTIADFNLAQKKLQSVLGETANGMKDVEKSAIQLGRSSIFGAKGVTELQIELAKMGFTKGEIISMQEAINNLATATQEDLASSAEVVANILRTFNLTASQSTEVVDIMGKAFNDSALDLSNFRESIKYVAPIAAQANFTFAETVSLLEQLSNAGIKGSLAGTGLTNIISRLGDVNSKFTKTLGRTVNGFDEFIAALIELKERGVDINDTFELVDRRAAATFSVLLQGVSSVEQFKQKLEESAGVMRDQAGVQMESLTFKTKQLKNSWDGLILSIDSGNGALSNALGSAIVQAQSLLDVLNAISGGGTAKIERAKQQESILKAWGIPEPDDFRNAADKLADPKYGILPKLFDIAASKFNGKPDNSFSKAIEKSIEKGLVSADVVISEKANEMADIWIDASEKVAGGQDKFNKQLYLTLTQLNLLQTAEVKGTGVYIQREAIIKKLTERYKSYQSTLEFKPNDGGSEDAQKKALQLIQDRIQAEIDLLEEQKKTQIEAIKVVYDGATEKARIGQTEYAYDKLILDKKLELALKSGETELQRAEKNALQKKQIESRFAQSQIELFNFVADEIEKIDKKTSSNFIKKSESCVDQLNAERKKWLEYTDAMRKQFKFDQENPIASFLGIKDDEQLDVANKFFDQTKTQITSLFDSWVSGLDRIVDARQRMVEEAQDALTTELALAEAGFASNVSLKRKELEESKRLRREAIEDQQKAQKVQLAIDSATQLSSLATATADYFKSTAKIPIIGVLLAIAAATTMFATFAKFKNLAKEQSAVKYEKGGWIYGKRHSQGGVPIEAEGGEFMINRKSALKHKSLIEAINKDDSVSINRLHINGIKNGVLSAKVSLDDSEDLKAIRKSLESNGKRVEYHDGYRIEYNGSTITKIKNA